MDLILTPIHKNDFILQKMINHGCCRLFNFFYLRMLPLMSSARNDAIAFAVWRRLRCHRRSRDES